MKELSLDNGIHFVDLDNLTESQKEKINEYWDEIINAMDDGDREETNNLTIVNTDSLDGKIDYIWDYLQIASNDLILG